MKLYNTLSRQVDDFAPLSGKKVKIYSCGLTVYNQPHVGNWIGYIYWDVLVRTLRAAGYEVERTQNITDVGHLTSDDDNGEDKMEKGARREGVTAWDVAEKYIHIADTEAKLLELAPPDHLIRATATIDKQIAFAQRLDEKGFLYRIDGDGMYFDTSKFPTYGQFAHLDIDGLEAGSRVSVEGKRHITDFAVWKFSPKDRQRDMEWGSPWGKGFPGWHLECSVIAMSSLGDQIDIHTGGIDHIPVHHTNEIAQTEAVTGKPFSQFWLHVNHIKSDGQKMSKSLGNVYTLQDILDRGIDIVAFRLFALAKHYRTEGNFTWENLEASANRLKHWQEVADLRWQRPESDAPTPDILAYLVNDLDTPGALVSLEEYLSTVESANQAPADGLLNHVADLLGINLKKDDIADSVKETIATRESFRQNKDWAKSDELRAQLQAQGIGLRDTQSGVVWYRL